MFSLFPQESPWCQWFSVNPYPRLAPQILIRVNSKTMSLNQCFSWKKKIKKCSKSPAFPLPRVQLWSTMRKSVWRNRDCPRGRTPTAPAQEWTQPQESSTTQHPQQQWAATAYKESLYKTIQVILGWRNLVNKGTTPGSLTRLWETWNLLDLFGQHSKI